MNLIAYLINLIFLTGSVSINTRPTGITILAILQIISGIIAIAFGAVFGALLGGLEMDVGTDMMMLGNEFAGLFGIMGGVMIALGLISFLIAWGLLKGKSWAWTITLILTIISLVIDISSFNIIGMIIEIMILYYLFRPHVKAYLGKGPNVPQ